MIVGFNKSEEDWMVFSHICEMEREAKYRAVDRLYGATF